MIITIYDNFVRKRRWNNFPISLVFLSIVNHYKNKSPIFSTDWANPLQNSIDIFSAKHLLDFQKGFLLILTMLFGQAIPAQVFLLHSQPCDKDSGHINLPGLKFFQLTLHFWTTYETSNLSIGSNFSSRNFTNHL